MTDDMTEHYSTVRLDEKRVVRLDEKRVAMAAVAAKLGEGKVALSVAPSPENEEAA